MLNAISLFSSGGIGDLALRDAGFDILVSNEFLADRHAVFAANYPNTDAITGDIWTKQDVIIAAARKRLGGQPLHLLYATPPCQGMSKNGRGKLLSEVRAGRKPKMDERNRLILPALNIAKALQPEIVLLENVPEMENTYILDDDGNLSNILNIISSKLGPDYRGKAEIVEFADYGVPQCRRRLITVFSRLPKLKEFLRQQGTLLPQPTHSSSAADGLLPWPTVRQAIDDLPPLDAKDKQSATSEIPFHRVPLLDEKKYWWVENTPEGATAFDNQCAVCGFQGNQRHTARHNSEGINRSSAKTPIHCAECGAPLPRPTTETKGQRKLMKGFTSAYKRMSWDRPASALTRNLSYACSDNKLHPEQNRVLSLHEAFILHTINQFEYHWKRGDGGKVSDKLVRELIGESIPPAGLATIVNHLVELRNADTIAPVDFGPLFKMAVGK